MHPLHQLMCPSSLAFWGASNNPMKMGTIQLTRVLETGYKGDVYPIHPTESTVLGLPAYRSIADVGRPVDVAQLTLPTKVVPQVLEECGRAGVRRAIIISGGFSEAQDGGGEDLEREVVGIARRHGIRFLGPNCVGIFNTLCSINSTTIPNPPGGGNIGFASQSGAYTAMINPYLRAEGVKMCQTISVGNEADTDLVDCIEYFTEEPEIRAIGLYVETVRRPREFIRAAREAARTKPIVAIYVGGSEAGSRASLSHTGALTGPDVVYDGLFREAGVIRAEDIDQMFDYLKALASQPPLLGDRVAVISNSGGPGTSLAYQAEKAGLSVPVFSDALVERLAAMTGRLAYVRNPIDLTFEMDVTLFGALVDTVFDSGEVDAGLLYGIFGWEFMSDLAQRFPDLSEMKDPWEKHYNGFLEGLADASSKHGKPLFVMSFLPVSSLSISPLVERDVPVYTSAARAARAMSALRSYELIRGGR
jgi:acyl-CoA synthetase (NDP forming)